MGHTNRSMHSNHNGSHELRRDTCYSAKQLLGKWVVRSDNKDLEHQYWPANKDTHRPLKLGS